MKVTPSFVGIKLALSKGMIQNPLFWSHYEPSTDATPRAYNVGKMSFSSVLILGSLILLVFPAKAAFLSAASSDASPQVREWLRQTEAKIPPQVLKLTGSVEVAFSEGASLSPRLCGPAANYQDLVKSDIFVARRRIYLNKKLLPFINPLTKTTEAKNFPCPQESGEELATRALLFQIAKIYDKAEAHWSNKTDREARRMCEIQYRGTQVPPSRICDYYLNARNRVSDSPSYQNLADFKDARPQSKNDLSRRTSHFHEWDSPQEHFAYNFSQFLFDSSYACRRPSLHAFFTTLMGASPFAQNSCPPTTHVYTSTGSWKIDVAPSKVYAVHFLFASKGEEIMSHWGHSMLRLVVCAPSRPTVGPECLEDVAYHVVLSYRANVNDVITNYWDGLTGKYPSQLMVFSLPEVIDEYTRGQWRNLISLPLKLSPEEKNLLVASALEHYWSYTGDYKFLTNNCASETDQLLRAALPKDHLYQNTFAASPLGFYKNLSRFHLIDTSLLKNKETAKSKGYFFPSQKESLEKAYAKMKVYFPKYKNLEEWAQGSFALERRPVYEKLKSLSDIGAAYLLEKFAAFLQEMNQQKWLAGQLQNEAAGSGFGEILAGLQASSQQRLPWNLSQGGYGVPLATEVISDEELEHRHQENARWIRAYRDLLTKRFPEMDQELNEIKTNLELLTNLRRF